MNGFDLETAIKMFLAYKEWGHSVDLTAFLEFVKEQGVKIESTRIERERILLSKIECRDKRIREMEITVGRLVLDLPKEDLEAINKMILRNLENE